MGNKLTGELSHKVDERLMDIAQMFDGLDYGDIMKFGKKADKKAIKQVKKLIEQYEEEEGENEETVKTIISFVLVIIGKEDPIEIIRFSETIDSWGRTYNTKGAKAIKKILGKPKEFTDDMFFEDEFGGYTIDDLEGKIVKVGEFIIAVPFYSDF